MRRNNKSHAFARRRNEGLIGQSLDRLAAILLRNGIDSPAAEKMMRRAFVRAAARSSTSISHSPTQTQIASIAGVSRREVRDLLGTQRSDATNKVEPTSKLTKLIRGWATDPLFSIRRGSPRPLQYRGSKTEFEALVRKYGRDITKKALRTQLVALGLAKEQQGKLQLVRETPSPGRLSAASADLRFVASQLADIDFELGRRRYLTKRVTLEAEERKSIEAMRQIAINRLGTVLSSLQSISSESPRSHIRGGTTKHRLLVSTTITVESEEIE